MKTHTLLMTAIVAIALLSACRSQATSTQLPENPSQIPPSSTATDEPASTITPTEATPTPEIFNPAPIEAVMADKTREDLATRLGLDFSQISVLETTQQVWPDDCLGLAPTPGTECASASVPGWRIVLNAAGHTHEYRATQDGKLVLYSGPVTVVGPEACKLSGTSMIFSPEDGYCFAYPVIFYRTDEHGPIIIYGPTYGSGAGALSASLSLDFSLLSQGQTLEGTVDVFLAQVENNPQPVVRQAITMGGKPAILLEVVPGTPGTRDVFLIHNNLLFHFIFRPAPAVSPETAADVEDLYQTVISSMTFMP